MNYVFISYAGKNYNIAKKLEEKINEKLESSFCVELVEDRKEGDTTFTEKVIKSFKKCNVFIVLITNESKNHQWVNQEWGYAKCLKELGQIQLLLHVTRKSYKGRRIKSKGFISTNMDFIDLEYNENRPNIDKMIDKVIKFLKDKEQDLIPRFTEKQEKLNRFLTEIEGNMKLSNELIRDKNQFIRDLSINPLRFQKDYALHVLQIGHLFHKGFTNKIESYVKIINEINIRKNIMMDWAILRGQYHSFNTDTFYKLLKESSPTFTDMRIEAEQQLNLIS